MNKFIVSILIFSILSPEAFAAPAKCNVQDFKQKYIDLQNKIIYSGKKSSYNPKMKGISLEKDPINTENSPGKKIEKALFNNYLAALEKVRKIFEHLNGDKTLSKAESDVKTIPEVTEFFRALKPETEQSSPLTLNIDTLIDNLKKVKLPNATLDENDVYLLKKLIIHSQDRICTLEKSLKKGRGTADKKYLEDLRLSLVNKMIEMLRRMNGTEDLQFSNEDLAIDQAIKKLLSDLHESALNCKKQELYPLRFEDKVQVCNYQKFIDSLLVKDAAFRPIEALLHFINANQETATKTSLDWLNKEFEESKNKIKCKTDSKSNITYIKNLNLDNQDFKPSILECTTKEDKKIKGQECIGSLQPMYDIKEGVYFEAKSANQIKSLSLTSIIGCSNIQFKPLTTQTQPTSTPPVTTQVVDPCAIIKTQGGATDFDYDACPNKAKPVDEKCKDPEIKNTTTGKCELPGPKPPIEPKSKQDECLDKNKKESPDEIPSFKARYEWKDGKCIDNNETKKKDEEESDPPALAPERVAPPGQAPPRFQPTNIPGRQIFMLPGMP